MQIRIDIDDKDAERAMEALGRLWNLTDEAEVPRKRADGEEIVDIVKTPRPADSADLKEFCLKHLRALVKQYESRQIKNEPAPFAGK